MQIQTHVERAPVEAQRNFWLITVEVIGSKAGHSFDIGCIQMKDFLVQGQTGGDVVQRVSYAGFTQQQQCVLCTCRTLSDTVKLHFRLTAVVYGGKLHITGANGCKRTWSLLCKFVEDSSCNQWLVSAQLRLGQMQQGFVHVLQAQRRLEAFNGLLEQAKLIEAHPIPQLPPPVAVLCWPLHVSLL